MWILLPDMVGMTLRGCFCSHLLLLCSLLVPCVGERCQVADMVDFRTDEGLLDYALQRHVVESFYLKPPMSCFSLCMMDCRCNSYNLELSTGLCELNSDSKFSVPQALSPRKGYRYYNIQIVGKTQQVGSCENSCCLTDPCLNGGQCRQLCDHTRKRLECSCPKGYAGGLCQFKLEGSCADKPCLNNGVCMDILYGYNCTCPPGLTGKNCQTDINECATNPCGVSPNYECIDKLNGYQCVCAKSYFGDKCENQARTCFDYKSSSKSGWYYLADDENKPYLTYCYIDNDVAYTLALSFTLGNNHIYKSKPLYMDFERNNGQTFADFRLSLARMNYLKKKPRVETWVWTCNYDTVGVVLRDYFRTTFNNLDFTNLKGSGCYTYQFINLQGRSSYNKKAMFSQSDGETLHMNSQGCSLDISFSQNYDLFGLYNNKYSQFACSTSDSSTTQLWFRET